MISDESRAMLNVCGPRNVSAAWNTQAINRVVRCNVIRIRNLSFVYLAAHAKCNACRPDFWDTTSSSVRNLVSKILTVFLSFSFKQHSLGKVEVSAISRTSFDKSLSPSTSWTSLSGPASASTATKPNLSQEGCVSFGRLFIKATCRALRARASAPCARTTRTADAANTFRLPQVKKSTAWESSATCSCARRRSCTDLKTAPR